MRSSTIRPLPYTIPIDAPHPPSAPAPRPVTVAVLFTLLCLIWGSTWLVIREGLRDLPTFGSAALRFFLAGMVMLLLAPRLARAEGGRPPAPWLWLMVGTLQFAASFGIVYWSETRLPSGLVALLWAVFPLCVAFWSRILLPSPERLSLRQWLGFLLALVGVALLFWTDLVALGGASVPAGLVLLLSPLLSSVSTVLLKRHGAGTSSALLNRNALLQAAALLGVTSVGCGESWPDRWTGTALFSLAYLSLFGTVVTFGIYFWLMRHVSAWRLSLISYLTPTLALTLGAVLAGEPLYNTTVAGAVVIFAGVAAATLRWPAAR